MLFILEPALLYKGITAFKIDIQGSYLFWWVIGMFYPIGTEDKFVK